MEPISHYTDAVRFGEFLFVSGCAPVDGNGRLVGPGDAEAQAHQVLRNLETVLAAGHASLADVVKVTVFLTDMRDRESVNSARRAAFGDTRPASTLIEVSALALPGMLVEIDAVAGLGDRRGARTGN
jgi:reactive intermediate/imine deaminase